MRCGRVWRVLGSDGDSPTWRIDRIALELGGATRLLDTTCLGQDWPVANVEATSAGWVMGSFSDGAGTYIAGWDVATGARLPFTD